MCEQYCLCVHACASGALEAALRRGRGKESPRPIIDERIELHAIPHIECRYE